MQTLLTPKYCQFKNQTFFLTPTAIYTHPLPKLSSSTILMADFAGAMQSFKPSHPFSELELMNHYGEINPCLLETPSLCFSNDNFLSQHENQVQESQFPFTNLQGVSSFNCSNSLSFDQSLASPEDMRPASKKQKVDSMSGSYLEPVSDNGVGGNNKNKKKNNLGRGKRGRNNERDVEKPKEVIHVRARRGQATDSHSLAERVRREKINEKLRCLQDLVPGCYKTMGMAVMLDEIIGYVQSLQNQVEFLSMKLTAASSFYDFNSDTEPTHTMQGTNAYEAQEVERLVRGGGEGFGLHTTWAL